MLGTYVSSFDIISYVCINPWPVNCCCSYQLHCLKLLCVSCKFVLVLSCSSGGVQILLPFTSRPSSMENSYLIPLKCQEILGTWCVQSGHPFKD